jgi:hypothetical protein
MSSAIVPPASRIAADRVRYVKLGPKGCWEDEAIQQNILLIDFDTGSPHSYAMCREGRWDEVAADWRRTKSPGVATRFTNETRIYFEDPGEILWVTFAHDRLYWGFVEPAVPEIYRPDDSSSTSTFRRIRGGWSDLDAHGRMLTKTSLPGSITSAASFRGTSFELGERERDWLLNRINGETDAAVERLTKAQEELRSSLGVLVQRLDPKDFEMLVDMLFLAAGWRRLGRIGGTEKTKDLDLQMPVTGERAWVQIKCKTKASDFAKYLAHVERMPQYGRMFFVYHTGEGIETDREGVDVLGLGEVVDMVIGGGFVNWVIERTS